MEGGDTYGVEHIRSGAHTECNTYGVEHTRSETQTEWNTQRVRYTKWDTHWAHTHEMSYTWSGIHEMGNFCNALSISVMPEP